MKENLAARYSTVVPLLDVKSGDPKFQIHLPPTALRYPSGSIADGLKSEFSLPAAPGRLDLTVMSDVTRILTAIKDGEPRAADELLPIVYDELRRLAAHKLAQEKPGQTLQATALLHEAYLRLVDVETAQLWDCRSHFFAAAAEAMRRILVENARQRRSEKRGGQFQRIDFDVAQSLEDTPGDELLALDEALDLLAAEDPIKAELVKLRCFAGLSHQDAAKVLGISRTTADRYWAYVKSWLYCKLYEPEADASA